MRPPTKLPNPKPSMNSTDHHGNRLDVGPINGEEGPLPNDLIN